MTGELVVGAAVEQVFTVDVERTIDFMGEDARVYATPSLVRDIENTCRNMLIELIDAGQDSVGLDVSIKHFAPTLLGMDVTVAASIAEVDGSKVVFDISASDSVDKICAGKHTRFVVDVEKTKQRLLAKAQKAADAE